MAGVLALTDLPNGGEWMKKILVHLAEDQPIDTSVVRLSLIGTNIGSWGLSQTGEPHHGGYSLECLPFWKSKEVFSASRTISVSVLGLKYDSLSHGFAHQSLMSSRRIRHEPS
jgi:hypothetical protein